MHWQLSENLLSIGFCGLALDKTCQPPHALLWSSKIENGAVDLKWRMQLFPRDTIKTKM
jgi:hypothetical protein